MAEEDEELAAPDDEDDDGVEEEDVESVLVSVFVSVFDVSDDFSEDDAAPLAVADDEERESVMYQPLPLNTMPTGWITLRSAPPHCSQVVKGGSEKLWRFSIISSQAVHL